MNQERLVRKRSRGFLSRLRRAWLWVALQFVLTLVLLLAGLAWTRLPDKHVWQVGLTLLIPLLLALCWLELQAGTIRKLARDDGNRVKLIYGAAGVFAWVVVAWAAWQLLNWCDDRIPLWAGYLNSKASAHARAGWMSFQHLTQGMVVLEWIVRWIVVPGKAIPFAATSALWGMRVPVRRVVRFLFSVRWWPRLECGCPLICSAACQAGRCRRRSGMWGSSWRELTCWQLRAGFHCWHGGRGCSTA
jgi:hypothetical protein